MPAMTDQQIWEALDRLSATMVDWSPGHIISAVAAACNLDRGRVAQVWRERTLSGGAG